jgi:hypothetical protein
MAAQEPSLSVHTPYVFAPDLVTLKEASALFAPCGPGRDPDVRTLKRWALKHGVVMEKAGKDDLASWTALVKAHAAEIDRREAGGRR